MKTLKAHPRLAKLHDSYGVNGSAINLRGYVGPASNGTVRLFTSPNSETFLEIPESAVIEHDQTDEDGITELFLDPSVIVTVVSRQKAPLLGALLRQKDKDPDSDKTKELEKCIERKIQECLRDPFVKNKEVCRTKEARIIFELACSLRDPAPGSEGPIVA